MRTARGQDGAAARSRAGLVAGLILAAAAPAGAGQLRELAREATPLVLKDGRIAHVAIWAVPFRPGASELDAEVKAELVGLVETIATDCFLTAQAIGHVEPEAAKAGESLAAHRLARARADRIQQAMVERGLQSSAIASVWDWQFLVKEPRVTVWVFRLHEGDDCEGKRLDRPAAVAAAAPPGARELPVRTAPPPAPGEAGKPAAGERAAAERATAAASPGPGESGKPPARAGAAPARPAAAPASPAEPAARAEPPPPPMPGSTPPPRPAVAARPAQPPPSLPGAGAAAEEVLVSPLVAEQEAAAAGQAPPAAPDAAAAAGAAPPGPATAAPATPAPATAARASPPAASPPVAGSGSAGPARAAAGTVVAAAPAGAAAPPAETPAPPASGPTSTARPSAALDPAAATGPARSSLELVFDVNSSYLPKGAAAELRSFLKGLPAGAPVRIELEGAVGGADVKEVGGSAGIRYNRWLAERRVGRVADWLKENAGGRRLELRTRYRDDDPSRKVTVRLAAEG